MEAKLPDPKRPPTNYGILHAMGSRNRSWKTVYDASTRSYWFLEIINGHGYMQLLASHNKGDWRSPERAIERLNLKDYIWAIEAAFAIFYHLHGIIDDNGRTIPKRKI